MSNDPNPTILVCPFCGGSSEDFDDVLGEVETERGVLADWECPCGRFLTDAELLTPSEFRYYSK